MQEIQQDDGNIAFVFDSYEDKEKYNHKLISNYLEYAELTEDMD